MIVTGVDFDSHGYYYAQIMDGVLVSIWSEEFQRKRKFIERIVGGQEYRLMYGRESSYLESDCVGVEGYMARFDKEGVLACVYWTLLQDLWHEGLKEQILPAPSWKKGIGIRGNANKDDVKEQVLFLYPELKKVKSLKQDHFDAVAICHAAYRVIKLEAA